MKYQLPGFVITELFSKSLVIIDDTVQHKPVPENITKSNNWFLGNYEKKIVIVVNDKANVYLDDESLAFLTGILSACKLNLAHVALINFNVHEVTFSKLKKEMSPKYLLLFGVTALQVELPFIMPDYKVQAYDNCSLLTAPALQILNSKEGKTEKAKLWKSLQQMFDLN